MGTEEILIDPSLHYSEYTTLDTDENYMYRDKFVWHNGYTLIPTFDALDVTNRERKRHVDAVMNELRKRRRKNDDKELALITGLYVTALVPAFGVVGLAAAGAYGMKKGFSKGKKFLTKRKTKKVKKKQNKMMKEMDQL